MLENAKIGMYTLLLFALFHSLHGPVKTSISTSVRYSEYLAPAEGLDMTTPALRPGTIRAIGPRIFWPW